MKVILLDGKNALYRFGWAYKDLSTEDGTPTGVLYGFAVALLQLKREFEDAKFVVAWDGPGKGWRHRLFPEYKSNRGGERPAAVQRIHEQSWMLASVCAVLGIPLYSVPKVEADDLLCDMALGCLAHGWQPIIYSGDRDFVQLMPQGVWLIRKGVELETKRSVMDVFGVPPEKVLALRVLCGDKSDAIPNVLPRLGPATAKKYLDEGVDPLRAVPKKSYPSELKAVWEDVQRNYQLMCLQPKRVAGFQFDYELLLRSKGKSYPGMVRMLCDLEMEVLLEERHDLWNIQRT